MRKALAYRIVLVVLLVAALIPLISHLVWRFERETVRRILILDKTVLNTWTDEHRSFVWLLRHHKIVPEKGRLYDAVEDYYGFFPLGNRQYGIRDFKGMSDEQLDSIAVRYDMAYYTDTYGIYQEEWNAEFPTTGMRMNRFVRGFQSTKIYGGMEMEGIRLLERFKERGKPVITEFNLIAAPTESPVREAFEKMWGLRWSGWTGRYFRTLNASDSADLPAWLIEAYKVQRGRDWPFTKSGIVFVHEDGRIAILEQDTHLNVDRPVIRTSTEGQSRYGVPAEMPYPFWFDIHSHNDSLKTVASYELALTETGKELLDRFGIPHRFPAVMTHHAEPWRFHYFAGDFADNPVSLKTAPFAGIHLVSGWFHTEEPDDRGRFFWDYYRPMMRSILDR